MNCVEKIIAARTFRGPAEPNGIASVKPGDQVLCEAGFRGMHEYTAGMVMHLYAEEWGDAPVKNPELVAAFEDHFVLLDQETVPLPVKNKRLAPAQALTAEMVEVCQKNGIRLHGPGRDLPAGVCHRIVVEDYALPGTIVVLTDSHTPTAGVLNSFAFGVGSTAMSFALRTGLIPVTVPKCVRVVVEGDARGLLSPKDLILHLIGDPYFREEQWRESPTDTCVVEFAGSGLEQWNTDELSVLTNMTVEGGLMTGIVEPTEPVREFLLSQRGDIDVDAMFVHPDPDASYVRTIHVNLDEVPLTVATPGDSRNRAPLDEHTAVDIHNVVIASCTGGSLADLRAAAAVLGDRKFKKGVRVTVTPSSADVAAAAEAEGILERFRALGAFVSPPGLRLLHRQRPRHPPPRRDDREHDEPELRSTHGRAGAGLPRVPRRRCGLRHHGEADRPPQPGLTGSGPTLFAWTDVAVPSRLDTRLRRIEARSQPGGCFDSQAPADRAGAPSLASTAAVPFDPHCHRRDRRSLLFLGAPCRSLPRSHAAGRDPGEQQE